MSPFGISRKQRCVQNIAGKSRMLLALKLISESNKMFVPKTLPLGFPHISLSLSLMCEFRDLGKDYKTRERERRENNSRFMEPFPFLTHLHAFIDLLSFSLSLILCIVGAAACWLDTERSLRVELHNQRGVSLKKPERVKKWERNSDRRVKLWVALAHVYVMEQFFERFLLVASQNFFISINFNLNAC
jgi:hypothetical protein